MSWQQIRFGVLSKRMISIAIRGAETNETRTDLQSLRRMCPNRAYASGEVESFSLHIRV